MSDFLSTVFSFFSSLISGLETVSLGEGLNFRSVLLSVCFLSVLLGFVFKPVRRLGR